MIWTPEDDATLATLYQVHSATKVAQMMGRTRPSVKNRLNTLAIKKPADFTGKGHFQPGMVPWNKGRAYDSGGRSHETRFKAGCMPHTWRPIGHERVTKEGYRERKMTDTRITRQDYVGLHILLWREHHGAVPDGLVVVLRDGNKENIVIGNLECVTRAELMRRNSYHTTYPPEVRGLIQLRGAVTRQINKRTQAKETQA